MSKCLKMTQERFIKKSPIILTLLNNKFMVQLGGDKVVKQILLFKGRENIVEIIHQINKISKNLRFLKAINHKFLDKMIKIKI